MAKKKKGAPEFVATPATEAQMNSFERNYASDPEISSRFMAYVSKDIQNTRNNRLQVEDKWITDIRLWSCVLDGLGYQGRSQIFVPELHTQIEQGVEKDIMATFPTLDTVDAIPINGTPADKAIKIATAVEYELMEKAQLYLKHSEFERQKRLTGTSIYKMGFKKDMLSVFWRNKDGQPMKQLVPKYHGVDVNVVDMFHWYIYPETSDLDSCKGVFEDSMMTLTELRRDGRYVNLDGLGTVTIDPNHQWSDVEQLNISDLASALASRPDAVFVTEIWTEFELGGKWVPVVGTIANNGVLIRLTRNPFWFQTHPYLGDVYVKRPGKIFYGLSMPDKVRGQQYQMNDLTNHTMDSLTFSLNPITIIDPALAGDVNSMKVSPGAKWLGSPEGVRPYQFPDVSGSGLRAMQEIRGQVAQFSDNSAGVAPQLEGKARSATQATIVQQNVTARQKISAKTEEFSIFGRMCKLTHSLLVQYMEDEWQVKYQGPDAGEWIVERITPNDINGEVDWIWKTVTASEKSAVRSQQLLAFFKEAIQISQMQPGEIDMPALFKRIAKEAFDLGDMDQYFKSLRDKKTIDPMVENIALFDGENIPVHNGDDDDYHMLTHDIVLDDPKASDEAKLAVIQHKEVHKAQKQAKAQVAQMKARMEAMKEMMGEEGGPMPGGPQRPPNPMEGNQAQAMSSPDAIMTGARGSEPNL